MTPRHRGYACWRQGGVRADAPQDDTRAEWLEGYADAERDAQNGHVHSAKHWPASATGFAICECGASARVEYGQLVGRWHACDLCVA